MLPSKGESHGVTVFPEDPYKITTRSVSSLHHRPETQQFDSIALRFEFQLRFSVQEVLVQQKNVTSRDI